jgi:hypothetical protein
MDTNRSLASILPAKSCLIFGHIDHEPYITEYEDTSIILEIVTKYKGELSQDGYIEFGFLIRMIIY